MASATANEVLAVACRQLRVLMLLHHLHDAVQALDACMKESHGYACHYVFLF